MLSFRAIHLLPLGTMDGVRWGPGSAVSTLPQRTVTLPGGSPALEWSYQSLLRFSGFLSFTHTHAHTHFHQLLQTPEMQQKLYVMTELAVHHKRACSGCGPLHGQGQSHGPGLAVRMPALLLQSCPTVHSPLRVLPQLALPLSPSPPSSYTKHSPLPCPPPPLTLPSPLSSSHPPPARSPPSPSPPSSSTTHLPLPVLPSVLPLSPPRPPPPPPAPLPVFLHFTRFSFRDLRLLLYIAPSHPKSPQFCPGQFCVLSLWTQPWRPISSILRSSRTAGVVSVGSPRPGQQFEPSLPLSCVHSPNACWASGAWPCPGPCSAARHVSPAVLSAGQVMQAELCTRGAG
ncbi:vegetative cell wall protein gp1-like [Cervus elaphus]|uniref:vegetative cell wall protein gp1-like n=1 Tax=Cervus elaphus TaxID=9860 RepID=UPI001CC329BD|nr:vegetative cell wall protein gp1-like [Cervus elaphus]